MRIIDLHKLEETHLHPNEFLSCCVGNFDGIHLGHQELIKKTIENKKEYKSAVWTFESNSKDNVKVLTTTAEKIDFFKDLGLDYVILENFDKVKELSKESFIKDVLFEKCHVRYGVCGFNFAFGYKAEGNANDFMTLFKNLNVKTDIISPVMINNTTVSSSLIRNLISNGDFQKANEYLGHQFYYNSPVIKGKQLGRKLGFPTINQSLSDEVCVPKFGVYKSKVEFDGILYNGISYFGTKPTITNETAIVCETHIFDFSSNLYGKMVKTYPLSFIRDELKFDSIDDLKNEILKNINECK